MSSSPSNRSKSPLKIDNAVGSEEKTSLQQRSHRQPVTSISRRSWIKSSYSSVDRRLIEMGRSASLWSRQTHLSFFVWKNIIWTPSTPLYSVFPFCLPLYYRKIVPNLIFITYKYPQVGQKFFFQLFVNISCHERNKYSTNFKWVLNFVIHETSSHMLTNEPTWMDG